MTPESLKSATSASKQISLDEAYKILGTDSNAGIEEVMKVSLPDMRCPNYLLLQAYCCNTRQSPDTRVSSCSGMLT